MRKVIVGCLISWGLVMGVGSSVHGATLDCSTATNINVPLGECQALLDLYDSTNGPSWANNGGWDTDSDICMWYGIACTNIAGQDRITSINLGSNNLNGTLPSSLSVLDQINYFDVAINQIGGVLPDAWSSWINIGYFYADGNQISGPLPSSRSTWGNINMFHMRSNQINGSLPDSWSAWTNILEFYVDGNQIGGVLPDSRSAWLHPHYFDVSNNQINGSLPDSWSTRNPEAFGASNNNLDGPLPDSWSTWIGMANFSINNNRISGNLPDTRATRTNIRQLNISDNQISGPLPNSRSGMDRIVYFYANSNEINGTLPDSWSTWTSIENFLLHNNQISGVLPDSRSSRQNIQMFGMSDNQLNGSLPDTWSSLNNLYSFEIRRNNLSGILPDSRSNLNNLRSFDVEGNQIGGSLPNAWAILNLDYLDLDTNQFIGILPDSRSNIPLSYFSIMNNNLTGVFPDSRSLDMIDRGSQYLFITNNCITTSGYNSGTMDWMNNNVSYNPQNDCTIRDLTISKNILQPLLLHPGDLVTYHIFYENLGPNTANDVTILDIPGTGLSIISASAPYSTQTITGAYGVPGDSCFDDMTNNTIGYYTDTLNQRAVAVYGAPNFQTVLENELGWTGGANRGHRFGIDTMNIFGSSFQDFLLSNLGIDINTIDSSCGSPDQLGYIFNLGTVGAGVTGEIFLTGQVATTGFTLGQTGIMNTAEISTSSSETSLINNRSSVIALLTGITTSSSGSSTGGSSSSSGSSGVIIIPTGFGGGFGRHTTTTSTGNVHNSAPTVVEQEVIEDNFSCPYGDGDFETYTTTMRDIPKTGAKREAILQLLKKCVVHGKRGEGKLYGTYSRITYGEVYKIIIRSLGLPFNEDSAGHRAIPYKAAARKAKLLQGSDTSHSLDDIADTKDVIVLLTNMVNYNGGSIDTLALESIRTPYILRGKFALLVTSLLKK